VPYVFEGIMQPGIENVSPVEVVLAADLPPAPEKLLVYKIATVDEEYITVLARRLGFNGGPDYPDGRSGLYTYVQESNYRTGSSLSEGIRLLEISADGSLQLLTTGTNTGNGDAHLPSLEEAEKIARDWLTSNDLCPAIDAEAKKSGGLKVTATTIEAGTPYSLVVKFQAGLGGYNIYTPVATVEIGDNGQIIGAYINIVRLNEYDTVSIRSPEAALSLLQARLSSPLADPPEARESVINLRDFEQLTLTRVTLQYTSGGGYLQPVYVFDGDAFSKLKPEPEIFKGKVDAALRLTSFVNSK
jgi:hypothetical protein